jgi:hypothetical protein
MRSPLNASAEEFVPRFNMPAPMTPPRTPSPMPVVASEPKARQCTVQSDSILLCASECTEEILCDPLRHALANQWSTKRVLHVCVVTSGYRSMDIVTEGDVTTVTISVDASPSSLRSVMVYIVEQLQCDPRLQLTRYYNFQLIGCKMYFVQFIKYLENLIKVVSHS